MSAEAFQIISQLATLAVVLAMTWRVGNWSGTITTNQTTITENQAKTAHELAKIDERVDKVETKVAVLEDRVPGRSITGGL